MKSGYLIAAVVFLACHAVRTGFERLIDSGRIQSSNKAVFWFMFGVMFLLWTCWFSMCPRDPWPIDLNPAIRFAGLAITVIGLILAVGATIQLRGVHNIDHLVTGGLFAILRHPMYVGFVCWIIGWSMYYNAMASFLVGIPGIINILYWRMLEERRLVTEYDEAYVNYRRRTWF